MIPTKGWIFIGLNGVRVISIVSMILVFSSSILVLVNDVKAVNRFTSVSQQANSGSNSTIVDDMLNCDYIENSTVPNQAAGAFWAVLNRLLIIAQVIALTLSELGWPMRFFEAYFPVLGRNFGVGALGVIQCLLGAAVLSHHVDDFALVSAFLLFSVGCLNILIGLIFREKVKSKRALLSWTERYSEFQLPPPATNPLKALHTGSTTLSHYSQNTHTHSNNTGASTNNSAPTQFTDPMSEKQARFGVGYTYGFGRAAERALEEKNGGLLLTRPLESVPPYYSPKRKEGTLRRNAGGDDTADTRSGDEGETRREGGEQ